MNGTLAASRGSLLLGIFAAITAVTVAGIQVSTEDDIAEARRQAEMAQLLEIFPPDTHDNALVDDTFSVADASQLGLRGESRAYRARQGSETVGVILPATAREGYSGDINLLVGIRADGSLSGVRVVTHRETPGLGDAVETRKSDWILSFNDRSLSAPAPQGWAVKRDGGEFDQFTGATITPRAVVVAVRQALEYADLKHAQLFLSGTEPTTGNADTDTQTDTRAMAEDST